MSKINGLQIDADGEVSLIISDDIKNMHGWTFNCLFQLERITGDELLNVYLAVDKFQFSIEKKDELSLLIAFKEDEKYMPDSKLSQLICMLPEVSYGTRRMIELYGSHSQFFFFVVGKCDPNSVIRGGLRGLHPMLPEWDEKLKNLFN